MKQRRGHPWFLYSLVAPVVFGLVGFNDNNKFAGRPTGAGIALSLAPWKARLSRPDAAGARALRRRKPRA